MNLKPYSSTFLTLEGILLLGIGLYFIFLRPPLLPEDLRYIGTTDTSVHNYIPGLANWLDKVFWVMGGYIFTTGLLTLYIARTSFIKKNKGAFLLMLFSGITSIGLMVIVNFIIQSDFKWVLFAFMFCWVIALVLYFLEKNRQL
jgi:hypothetical protein